MPAYIQHREIEKAPIVCPGCMGLLPMFVREVNALRYELERFIQCVVNDEEPAVTGEEGLRALRVAHDIIARIQEQKLVL